jgi:hypothetical protein
VNQNVLKLHLLSDSFLSLVPPIQTFFLATSLSLFVLFWSSHGTRFLTALYSRCGSVTHNLSFAFPVHCCIVCRRCDRCERNRTPINTAVETVQNRAVCGTRCARLCNTDCHNRHIIFGVAIKKTRVFYILSFFLFFFFSQQQNAFFKLE